jgi:hypothetical protein
VTTEWAEAEDEILLQAFGEFGPKWFAIAALLPGRGKNSVKNRCAALQRQMADNRGLRSSNPPERASVDDTRKTADPFSFLENMDEGVMDWGEFPVFGGF